jgi:AraC family transcriptional regulator
MTDLAVPSSIARYPTHCHETQVHAHLALRDWSYRGAGSPGLKPSIHAWVELSWVEHGAAVYRIEGREEFRVGAGEAVVVPAGVAHVTRFEGPTEATTLCIDRQMVDGIADAMGPETRARRLSPGVTARSASMLHLGRALRAEAHDTGPGRLLAADAIGEALVVELLRRAPVRVTAGAARDARVNLAVDRIQASYAEPLTVDELARCAGMSRFHFSRLFREQVGDAPYQYLLRVRVARAAELLRRGSHDVTEAAMSVGFQDLGRFGRMFRRHMGCRPSELTRKARSKTIRSR